MKNWKDILLIGNTILLVGVLTQNFFILDSGGPSRAKKERRNPEPKKVNVDMKQLVANATFKGEDNAPLTLSWWNSFSCGFCGRFNGTIKRLQKKYPGKVRVAYQHYNRGKGDMFSAQVLECAGEQGKFWPMADVLFQVRGKGEAKELAKKVGLNGNQLDQCVKSGKYQEKIRESMKKGLALNIRGTPGIVANSRQVAGAQRLPYWEKYFKEELN